MLDRPNDIPFMYFILYIIKGYKERYQYIIKNNKKNCVVGSDKYKFMVECNYFNKKH